jgi:hypothetical protein
VTLPLVPVRLLASVAVNVYVTPPVDPVVNTIVAMPALFVVELELANDPPAPVFVQFTTTPDVATGLPLASVNCAVIVTGLPATTVAAPADTTYFVATPAAVVIPGLLPVIALVVAVTTCVTPTLALVVKAIVATPLEFVVLVCEANDPPFVLDHVTVVPPVETAFPFTSANCAEIVTAVPAAGARLFDVTRY